MCSSYGKPYGLLSGVKIFTELEPAADDKEDDNSNKYEIEIATPAIFFNL